VSEEHCSGEPKICERCFERNADVVVNLEFAEGGRIFRYFRLCSPCFLILNNSDEVKMT
jgi:hypothetical protein